MADSRVSKNSRSPNAIAAGWPDTRFDGSRTGAGGHGPCATSAATSAAERPSAALVGRLREPGAVARHAAATAAAGAPAGGGAASHEPRARAMALPAPVMALPRVPAYLTSTSTATRSARPEPAANTSSQRPGMWNSRPSTRQRPGPAAVTVGA